MCPRQRPDGIVIKPTLPFTRRVTSKTSITIVLIPPDSRVLVVRFRVGMAGRARKLRKIVRVVVALRTLAPFAVVRPRVNREILRIVVKIRRYPSRLRVAGRTVRREARLLVVRVRRPVEVRLVTAHASVRRVRVIPVVTSGTVVRNRCVSTI